MGMWNDTSRKAAYEQFGKDNYRWLALWHMLPKLLLLAGVVGLFLIARAGLQAADGVSFPWGSVAVSVASAIGLVGVFRLATRSRRRGYRVPRSRY